MRKHRLLFIGRPSVEKGLSDLLKALSNLGHYNWQLSIVGKMPENVEISEFSYFNRVILMGALPNSTVPEIMNNNDIIIVPSHYENFGNVVIEALACGLIIVASCTGGIKDIIKDGYNGMLFKPKNYKQLSNQLEFIFNNPKHVEKLKINAILCSKQYDWENIARRTLELLNKYS